MVGLGECGPRCSCGGGGFRDGHSGGPSGDSESARRRGRGRCAARGVLSDEILGVLATREPLVDRVADTLCPTSRLTPVRRDPCTGARGDTVKGFCLVPFSGP